MSRLVFFAVSALFICGAGAALGCEASLLPKDTTSKREIRKLDTALVMQPDCSFENTDFVDLGDRWLKIARGANPVRDRGNGRVAQRLTVSGNCSMQEAILFVDCNAGESLIILGEGEPPQGWTIAGLTRNTVEAIQPPYGPISIGSNSTVKGLSKAAQKHGINTLPVSEYFAEVAKRDRYDHACGCKLYYPDSPMAQD